MFEHFIFSKTQIDQYLNSALNDLKIAQESSQPEVTFRFAYDALLKLAITISAKNNLRVKSNTGHHMALIQKLASLLKNEEILLLGNDMRKQRNLELYNGGKSISKSDAQEYVNWVAEIFKQAEKL